MAANTTTIEGWEKEKVAIMKRKGKIREYRYPYTLGLLGNLRAVFGPSLLLACWPRAAVGDGLSFPVGEGVGKSRRVLSDEEVMDVSGGGVEGHAAGREDAVADERRRWREEAEDEV